MSLLNVLIVLMFIIHINYTQMRFVVLPLSPMMSKLTVKMTCLSSNNHPAAATTHQ